MGGSTATAEENKRQVRQEQQQHQQLQRQYQQGGASSQGPLPKCKLGCQFTSWPPVINHGAVPCTAGCLGACRFVIGLPLFQKNAVEMSRQMMGQAKKYLGNSVIQYELGNEVS